METFLTNIADLTRINVVILSSASNLHNEDSSVSMLAVTLHPFPFPLILLQLILNIMMI